jgi:hypothetical protein
MTHRIARENYNVITRYLSRSHHHCCSEYLYPVTIYISLLMSDLVLHAWYSLEICIHVSVFIGILCPYNSVLPILNTLSSRITDSR